MSCPSAPPGDPFKDLQSLLTLAALLISPAHNNHYSAASLDANELCCIFLM
jgi:hypothetical protein